MADVTSIDNLSDGNDLTEAQIKTLRNRAVLNLHNILENKWDATPYTEFGDAGHKKDGATLIRELRQTIRMYDEMLEAVPKYEVTEFDNPSV